MLVRTIHNLDAFTGRHMPILSITEMKFWALQKWNSEHYRNEILRITEMKFWALQKWNSEHYRNEILSITEMKFWALQKWNSEHFRAYHVLSCGTSLCCTPIISCYVMSYHVMSYYVSTTLHHFKSYLTKLVPRHITSHQIRRHDTPSHYATPTHCTALHWSHYLWLAAALEMGVTISDSMPVRGLYDFCLQNPISTT